MLQVAHILLSERQRLAARTFNTVASDGLDGVLTQGARASVALVLNSFSRHIQETSQNLFATYLIWLKTFTVMTNLVCSDLCFNEIFSQCLVSFSYDQRQCRGLSNTYTDQPVITTTNLTVCQLNRRGEAGVFERKSLKSILFQILVIYKCRCRLTTRKNKKYANTYTAFICLYCKS